MNNAIKGPTNQHTCNYELHVTFRRKVVVTIEISTTTEQYLAATIETWPA